MFTAGNFDVVSKNYKWTFLDLTKKLEMKNDEINLKNLQVKVKEALQNEVFMDKDEEEIFKLNAQYWLVNIASRENKNHCTENFSKLMKEMVRIEQEIQTFSEKNKKL